MKKALVALCALALLGMTACNKEEDPEVLSGNRETPAAPTPTPTPTPTPQGAGQEGVYNPGARIVAISVDGAPSEQWTWNEDGQLVSVTDASFSTEKMHYTYSSDGRISSVTLNANGAMSGDMGVTYSGEYISALSVMSGADEIVAAQVSHNSANKVSGATLELEDDLLVDVFNGVISQFIGDSTGNGLINGMDSTSASVRFTWTGDNVGTAILNIKARLETTLGQIGSMIDDYSIFGSYGTIIQQMVTYAPDKKVYLRVSLADTAAYTYDNHVNPFRHNLGRLIPDDMSLTLDLSALTANNAASEVHSTGASLDVLIAITTTPMQVYHTDYPMAGNSSSYSYQYNTDGYPVSVTNQEGSVKTYTYQQ